MNSPLSPLKLGIVVVCALVFCALAAPQADADDSVSPQKKQSKTNAAWDYPPFGATDTALSAAFRASCTKFAAMPSGKQLGSNAVYGTAGQWKAICAEAMTKPPALLEDFLNRRLTKVTLGNEGEAKFTGYFKPVLNGSKTRHGTYQTPLLARPTDLTRCEGQTGQKQADGTCSVGYPTRGEIHANLDKYKVLVWLDDPIDAYFLHIQGSGTVELDDGKIMHLGFAGKNGHGYVAIGRTLKEKGALTGTINADKIRQWLKDNPERADEILNSNPSYIFFNATKEESEGAFGVKLVAGRSMAVDKSRVPLGLPLFVKSTTTFDKTPWQRIMFAHDVGSAIKGAGRGDIYFGHGPLAGERAGDQNSLGTMYAMVPKENVGMQAVARADMPQQPADILPDSPDMANIEPAAQ
jgi:membrane-bound lytic murein transglycosylase A